MLGSNTDEHRFFLVPTGLIDQLDDGFVNAALQIYGGSAEPCASAYDDRYSTAGELFAAAASDCFFRLPDIRLAEPGPAPRRPGCTSSRGARRSTRGSSARATTSRCRSSSTRSPRRAPRSSTGPEPPQELADEMHERWLTFAATGDPGWPRYTPKRRAVMTFDLESGVVDDPRAEQRVVWPARTDPETQERPIMSDSPFDPRASFAPGLFAGTDRRRHRRRPRHRPRHRHRLRAPRRERRDRQQRARGAGRRSRRRSRRSGCECLQVEVNIRDIASVDAFRDACLERFGSVDYLVNNAGGQFQAHPFDDQRQRAGARSSTST